MLDQEADDPLQRAENGAVDHHGAVRLVVRAGVLEPEPLGLLVVELDRGSLPFPPDGVVELDVDLRAVERAAALVEAVGDAAPLQRPLERPLRHLPSRVVTGLLVWAPREG